MRALLAIMIVVLLMAYAGWLVFGFGENSASVEVRSDEIQRDTNELLNRADDTFETDSSVAPARDSMVYP